VSLPLVFNAVNDDAYGCFRPCTVLVKWRGNGGFEYRVAALTFRF